MAKDITQIIEAVLFFKGEPMEIAKLAKTVHASEAEVRDALQILEEKLLDRGMRLMRKDDEVMLGTAPECGVLIEEIIKEDLNKDLGKAGLETLAIVIYLGPVTRSRMDHIRGVNSTFIIRNLMIRGLIEKVSNPEDQRSFLYRPTFELLSYLGVNKVEELPEYDAVREEIEGFEGGVEIEKKEDAGEQ